MLVDQPVCHPWFLLGEAFRLQCSIGPGVRDIKDYLDSLFCPDTYGKEVIKMQLFVQVWDKSSYHPVVQCRMYQRRIRSKTRLERFVVSVQIFNDEVIFDVRRRWVVQTKKGSLLHKWCAIHWKKRLQPGRGDRIQGYWTDCMRYSSLPDDIWQQNELYAGLRCQMHRKSSTTGACEHGKNTFFWSPVRLQQFRVFV